MDFTVSFPFFSKNIFAFLFEPFFLSYFKSSPKIIKNPEIYPKIPNPNPQLNTSSLEETTSSLGHRHWRRRTRTLEVRSRQGDCRRQDRGCELATSRHDVRDIWQLEADADGPHGEPVEVRLGEEIVCNEIGASSQPSRLLSI